eukprot:scaffold32823_cov198-Isochrysis_galbana.AAC.2
MLLAARHHTGRSMLLASLLAMCKTAGASVCGTLTLSSSNIATVQACTVINGVLEVFYLSMHTEWPLPTDPFVWLDLSPSSFRARRSPWGVQWSSPTFKLSQEM